MSSRLQDAVAGAPGGGAPPPGDVPAVPANRFAELGRVYLERRLLFVFAMGFASGLPLLLVLSTLSWWLTEAGVSLTAIGLFALTGTPYNFKFVWAPLLDRVPVPVLSRWLGQRRSWMLLIQLGLMAAIVALGYSSPESTPQLTAVAALFVAFFSASQDIVIDAYRIEVLDDSQQGAGAAMTQAGYRFGLIAAGAGALYLAQYLQGRGMDLLAWPVTYAVMAGLVSIGIVATLLAPRPAGELGATASGASRETGAALRWERFGAWLSTTFGGPFREFFSRAGVRTGLLILLFVVLYKLGDSFAGVMAYPFYAQIGFTKAQVATVSKIFGVGATLLGVFAGGLAVARFGVLKSLLGCGLLQMLSNLMYAAQAALGAKLGFLFLTIGIENFSGGMGSAAFIAYMSLLCHPSFTGTQFALLSSLMAVGRTTLAAGSGWLADHTSWVQFFVASTFVALPGLLLLVWLIKRVPMSVQGGRIHPRDGA